MEKNMGINGCWLHIVYLACYFNMAKNILVLNTGADLVFPGGGQFNI